MDSAMEKLNIDLDKHKHKEWPMSKIRSTFIDYYVNSHKHTYWPSSPCVPHDDPTLLFANAGMNQYKPLFLGTCDPTLKMASLKSAVNTQKCIRAGGKHNDLDDVGKDVYHHTFFEMMGNWSFGDYFKEGAIEMTYKCLTEVFKLDPERLYASYFGGDDKTPADEEAKAELLKYFPENRVLPFDASDNFWEMGATGPCGPCVEIHYDRIGGRDAAKLVNGDLPDVIEIWNNVFIQFNREADGSLVNLPAQHVDTGMGFERLASILQGHDSNYDTDIFTPLFAAIQEVTGCRDYQGKIAPDDVGYVDMAYRVVADHIRTLSFAIADGAVPSNDGRGYVLRRVLRRAVRYGRQNLGAQLGFFAKLVGTLVDLMGEAFPELRRRQDFITQVIMEEEASFNRTLDKGLKVFEMYVEKMEPNAKFSGDQAHHLFTSLGFPIDLTKLMCEEKGVELDMEQFEAKMKAEIEMSQRAHKLKMSGGSGKEMVLAAEQTSALGKRNVKPTGQADKYIWNVDILTTVDACFLGRNETEDKSGFAPTMSSEDGATGLVLLNTNFYAEQGGQIYDTGMIVGSDGSEFRVDNVQVYGGFVLHLGEVTKGTFSPSQAVTAKVNYDRRSPIAANHTLTHVLNYGLRSVLVGDDFGKEGAPTIDQKGSLCDDTKLRFDFSWNGPISVDQLAKVEKECQDNISTGVPVRTLDAPLEDAKQVEAIRAVFGEKYPDPVRIVSIGEQPIEDILAQPTNKLWEEYSIEFCGGTHLENTREAEQFVILSEEGIAKGIRRITAVTQEKAREANNSALGFLSRLNDVKTLVGGDLEQEVKKLTNELQQISVSAVKKADMKVVIDQLSAQVNAEKKKAAGAKVAVVVSQCLAEAKRVGEAGGDKAVVRVTSLVDGKLAKDIFKQLGKECPSVAVMMLTVDDAKDSYSAFAGAPKGVAVDCKMWVGAAFKGLGGRGGGKKDNAQWNVTGRGTVGDSEAKAKAF